jgi:hypothetical protein
MEQATHGGLNRRIFNVAGTAARSDWLAGGRLYTFGNSRGYACRSPCEVCLPSSLVMCGIEGGSA